MKPAYSVGIWIDQGKRAWSCHARYKTNSWIPGIGMWCSAVCQAYFECTSEHDASILACYRRFCRGMTKSFCSMTFLFALFKFKTWGTGGHILKYMDIMTLNMTSTIQSIHELSFDGFHSITRTQDPCWSADWRRKRGLTVTVRLPSCK